MHRRSFVMLSLAALVLTSGPTRRRPEPASEPRSDAVVALSPLERISLERAFAATDARFVPRTDGGVPVLETPRAVATFDGEVARIAADGHTLMLSAVTFGRAGGPVAALARAAAPELAGPEVRTDRGHGVVEWWRSLPSGLEHGVNVAHAPEGEGALVVELALEGLSPRSVSSDGVALVDGAGTPVLAYAQLAVLDARGERLPAHMEVRGDRVSLVVDDEGARYPLVIDPLLAAHEAFLLPSDRRDGDHVGCSVALSADGTRALVGASGDDTTINDLGSARVFLRTGTVWTEEATLLATSGRDGDHNGVSVALSADASRALVGGPDTARAGVAAGAARVFSRLGTVWTEEALLLPSSRAAGDAFGVATALSADGTRAFVGANGDDIGSSANAGSVHVFLRTGTTWVVEAILTAPDLAQNDELGEAVAVSSDGDVLVVGARLDDTVAGANAGSARVFVRTGTAWAQQATLLAPDAAPGDELGSSVSVSSDGSRVLVGAPNDATSTGTNVGSGRVYGRTGTVWAHEAALFVTVPEFTLGDWFGGAVVLSSDGSRAVLGSPRSQDSAGRVAIFDRGGTGWAQEGYLSAPVPTDLSEFGTALALSADATRLLVGESEPSSLVPRPGEAHVFTVLGDVGARCGSDATCDSGFCTDGVCCSTRCGAGDGDCEACSAALTGGADGTCAMLGPSAVCRPAAGGCDTAETCSGASTTCPADAIAGAGTVCRAPVDLCDAAETCDGTDIDCPLDGALASGTVCRAASGGCDVAEVCNGASITCPGDAFAGPGAVCRSVRGDCDVEELCPGGSPVCPDDVVIAAGTACRDAVGPCDVADECDGTLPTCEDHFVAADTVCAPSSGRICDTEDVCTGASGNCPERFLVDVVCRPASGACDATEVCSGGSADCPGDRLEAAGMVCRASTDPSCDPSEGCDGTSSACPLDVSTCVATDAGVADASVGDGGAPVVAAESCACRVHASRSPTPVVFGLVLALALAVRRRR